MLGITDLGQKPRQAKHRCLHAWWHINPVLPFPCVPTESMDENTSKKKLNVNIWILFHTTIVWDVMPEKDNFLIFSFKRLQMRVWNSWPYFSSFTSHCDSPEHLRNFCSFLLVPELPASCLLVSAFPETDKIVFWNHVYLIHCFWIYFSIWRFTCLWTFSLYKKFISSFTLLPVHNPSRLLPSSVTFIHMYLSFSVLQLYFLISFTITLTIKWRHSSYKKCHVPVFHLNHLADTFFNPTRSCVVLFI